MDPEPLRLLGFTPHETKVFAILDDQPQSIAAISRATELPRPSVVYVLKQLYKRGLIRKITVGKRSHWKRIANNALDRKLKALVTSLLPHAVEKQAEDEGNKIPLYLSPPRWLSTATDAYTLYGIDDIMQFQLNANAMHDSKRRVLTQLALATNIAIHHKKGPRYFAEMNKVSSAAHSITEILGSPETTKIWKLLSEHISVAKFATERLVDTSLVPSEFAPTNLPAELFVSGKSAMLTDWSTETSVVIHNEHIARMLVLMFRATKEFGKSFNSNNIFRSRLEQLL